jgi:PAS domain S-box-containing protein
MSSGKESVAPDHQLLREITDLLPAYVAYVDADLRYVAANRMYVERFGRKEQQIVGQLVKDVTGSAFENVAGHLRAALAGETQRFETRMISVDGDRTLAVAHLPHRDGQGNVVGVIVYGSDITERRQAEAALLQSEKLAAVGRLASSVAHEINNPLESVVNLLYLIEVMAEEDVEQARRYAVLAQAELARVTQVTTNTLRFFRQSTGRTLVNVGEMVESVLALYAGRLTNSNIVVKRSIDEGVLLTCFDGEVRQILNSLISNAIDAMRQGGSLQMRVRRLGREVRVTVADTGDGMNRDVQARMFEPFFTTKGIVGTGLGLWIAQELAAKHHGHLRVRSRGGEGTVMVLILPDENQKSRVDRTDRKISS